MYKLLNILVKMSLKMSPNTLDGLKILTMNAYQSVAFDSENNCYMLHHFCSSNDCSEAVQIIADKKFFLDHQDKFGYTALHISVRHNMTNYVKILINAGAKLNTQNVDGQTPLMTAAKDGNPEIIKILLDASADPNLKDKDGKTAMQLATLSVNPEICSILLMNPSASNEWVIMTMDMD